LTHGHAPASLHLYGSRRTLAAETGLSTTAVHRYLTLRPRRSKSFKLSTDPFFIEKVRDIVGLCLNPPDHALVLCVNEKSQVQTLERTQPVADGSGLRRWTSPTAASPRSANRSIGIRSSSRSCGIRASRFQSTWST
jgi:hypothetical protein